MKPANRKAYIKRIYQAVAKLIISSYRGGSITEEEYNRLLQALEAVQSDRLEQAELLRMLQINERKD